MHDLTFMDDLGFFFVKFSMEYIKTSIRTCLVMWWIIDYTVTKTLFFLCFCW